MKKWIFSLAVVFSANIQDSSLQMMVIHDHKIASHKFLATDADFVSPFEVEADYLAVKGMKIVGFPDEGLAKIKKAFEVLELVVNTEEFKDRVINFKNSSGKREFASNKGLSNEQIYQTFMEGREILQQGTPGEMNFYLNLYNKPWSKVIGYTNGDTNVIYINLKFFKGFRPSQVAANLAHEWIHKIGFDHKSAKEHDSAPYAIGYIVEDMASKFLQKSKLP